ncbi:MAG TPA: DUF4407 domain-containing protein [Longimicrobium sp.]|nr:DUF4407 domain-containing protein [Longimicrobium sp.]
MQRFFLFCAGVNRDILAKCPTDETKYAGIGATIVLTALMAVCSGGYALYTVFRSVPAAIVFGVFWGLVIFNLDRVIVSGMRKQKNFSLDLLFASPRFAIAVLLAVVISRPLELKMYERELTAEITQMNLDSHNAAVNRVNAGLGEVERLNRENTRLKREIEAIRQEVNTRYGEWIAERDGTGGSGVPGRGPRWDEKRQRLDDARQQLAEVKKRNDPVIQRNEQEIARLEAQRNQQIARTDTAQGNANGMLARMRALGALKARDDEVFYASWFITLVFVALETAPVMVKLLSTLSPFRPYDELLEEHEALLVEEAKQRRKVRKHELEEAAEKAISDVDDTLNTEMRLNSEKNRLRLDAELRANETLIDQIAAAQAELAERIVEEWKIQELDKIDQGLGTSVP